MPFTLKEQARLGELYAPIVFLSRNDVAPISPAEYVRRSALWSFPGPVNGPFGDEANKQSWGAPTADLMPGMLAASEDDPDIAERTLIWTHLSDDPGPAWFLDHGGWDDQDRTPTQPLPAAGEVRPASPNLMGSVGAAIGRWSHRDGHPPLDPHIGWYSVQAFDTFGDSQQLRDKLASQDDPAADHVMDVIARLPRPCWLVFYHLFFPACAELVRECELIQTLHALGIDVAGANLDATESAFPTSELTDLGFPYSLQWAGRLGQFVSLAAVVPVPMSPAGNMISSLLDVPDDQFLPPLFIGFGRSAPAVELPATGPPVEVPLMAIVSAEDAVVDVNHVRVFVSEANHNTYPQPGTFARPTDDTREAICDWAGPFPDADGEPVGEEPPPSHADRVKEIAALSKFLTMPLIAALLAAIAEAARGGREVGGTPPAPPLGPGEPQDAAEADPEGLILAPEEFVDTLLEDAAVVRPWSGTALQRVFDERWETADLSWGPPALQDPFRRRQGRPMSRYIGPFISALGRHLEEGG